MIIRTGTLKDLKNKGQKFAALTSYDSMTAEIFDQAGIEVILVGDSASNVVLGHKDPIAITLEDMTSFGKAVSSSVKSALVVLDLPFGSYEVSATQALENAILAMKQTGVAAVKLEGPKLEQIRALTSNGIPVMGHVGFTPQSVNALSGYKVQGRGDNAERIIKECLDIEAAGAFAIVLEMVPAKLAEEITQKLEIPTIGIGAGPATDGQILVWNDFAGLSEKTPSFVKRYLEMRQMLADAAKTYRAEIQNGSFPPIEKNFS
jgi:3-methyl-2-oxobutanoate hydroxymethyltransferase